MAVLYCIKNVNMQLALKNVCSVYGTALYAELSTDVNNVSVLSNDTEENEISNRRKEAHIESKRNVSRLDEAHRNLLLDKVPYPQPKADFHSTVKYRRKMYGQYGSTSEVNPGIMWPTKSDLIDRKEYESVAYPFTIQEMVQKEISKKEAEEAEIWARQKKITENLKKLNQWMKDIEIKRAKKFQAVTEAKAKKDRLIEEVRRHFGYTVDHREEKFQLMLEQKEKEERKAAKLEKKRKRDEMFMQEIIAQTQIEDKK